jgi:3-hydroxybutyryl-CoA dehydrogenase
MNLGDIKTAGVVGGGTMGFGIGLNFALSGIETFINDVNDEALAKTDKAVKGALDLFVEEELVSREQATDAAGRITLTTDLEELAAQSDFVTEAIVERLKDKQDLFVKLDAMCPPHAIIVSNTSGFVVSEIGEDVKRQDKIGLTHYFAPPHIVPGVEVAKARGTTDETYELICEVMEKTGRIPIRLLKEKPGYLLNRIQGAAGAEAARLWAEGLATAEDIELGVQTTFGFRMPHEGPFFHYDLAGIWKWPSDAGNKKRDRPEPEDEAAAKIRERMAEGKPWFVDPEKFDEAVERRDREYVRRLKNLYGSGKRDKGSH